MDPSVDRQAERAMVEEMGRRSEEQGRREREAMQAQVDAAEGRGARAAEQKQALEGECAWAPRDANPEPFELE